MHETVLFEAVAGMRSLLYCVLYDSGLNAQGFMLEGSDSQLSHTPVCPRDESHDVLLGFGAHSLHGSQLMLFVLLHRVAKSSCFYWHARLWVGWHVMAV